METVIPAFLKTCSKCGETKLSTEFGLSNKNLSGLKAQCRPCLNKGRQNWIRNNKDKSFEYNTKYWPAVLEKRKQKQALKQENNKCQICGCSLIGRQLLARYCKEHKKVVVNEGKHESYARNVGTYRAYIEKHKPQINKENAKRELKRRENLTDRYVTKLLREKHGFTGAQLNDNPEIIEVKRLMLKTKRL